MIDPRPNLGVDLDGVVCELWDPFRAEVLRRYNISILRDVPKYNIEECSELTREQAQVIFEEGQSLYRNLPKIPGAKTALIHLNGYYKLHMITHRDFYKGIQSDTRGWLDSRRIPYEKITFTNSNKIQEVLDAKCKYMIENCGETAIKLAELGQRVILLDYSYNRDFKHKLISRAKNWMDIMGILI